jgi:multidrug efflux system membrane fusion protein
LAVITQLHPISLVFTIPQDDIPRVLERMKQQEKLTVEAYDRNLQNKLATGTLSAIDNQVDASTGTLKLKAVFENEDNRLFPNQFVNARLLVETLPHAVTVNASAVQRGPEFDYVYVVQSDETVDLRRITLGPSEGNDIVIASGLVPGECVVTDGVDKLQPGTKVSLRNGGNGAAPKPGAPLAETESGRPSK